MKRAAPPASAEPPSAARARTLREDSNSLLGAGLGLGAFGAAGGLLLGAVCPVCIVATPALIGAGVVQRIRAARLSASRKHSAEPSSEVVDESPQAGAEVPTGSRQGQNRRG